MERPRLWSGYSAGTTSPPAPAHPASRGDGVRRARLPRHHDPGHRRPGRAGSAALYVYFRSKEEVLYQIAVSALDFTIEVTATEANRPVPPAQRLQDLVRVLTIWHTYNSQVAHVVLYQTGALSAVHAADIAAKQREVGRIVRQVITDGVRSGDFDVPDTGAATIAVLSLCLDVARWYHPGYRLSPQQLGDFHAAAALRITGGQGIAIGQAADGGHAAAAGRD